MKWIKRFLILIAALSLIALFVWAFIPKPVTVQLGEVTRGSFKQIIEEDGKTRVRERYVVSAPLTGKLQRITLKAGDAIEQNQVIAQIVPTAPALLDVRSERELTGRVGAAEAQQKRSAAAVAGAQAALEKSNADLKRARQLVASRFISTAQLEQTELEAKINSKELEAAQYADQAAKYDIATARAALMQLHDGAATGSSNRLWHVRSPIAGEVLKVIQESEGVVTLGTPLLEIGQTNDLEVIVDILSSDAAHIRPGAEVQMKGWGRAEPLPGRVRRVEPSAFTKVSALGIEEQRVNVIIDITAPPAEWQNLGDGYKIDTGIIIFSTASAIKVPVSALFKKDSQWAVFVASNGRAQTRAVQIARRSGLEATVESGLKPGEKVILYPGDTVKDGVKIESASKP